MLAASQQWKQEMYTRIKGVHVTFHCVSIFYALRIAALVQSVLIIVRDLQDHNLDIST